MTTHLAPGPARCLRQAEAALHSICGGQAQLLASSAAAWASVTFSGWRCTATLDFTGADAVLTGEAVIAELPGAEFAIPGFLVADAAIVWVRRAAGGDQPPKLTLQAELLLLEDARA